MNIEFVQAGLVMMLLVLGLVETLQAWRAAR